MKKVYIVTYATWGTVQIKKIFSSKKKAREYADKQEKERNLSGRSDGWIAYYVSAYEVE